jgi:hypothetical protein
MSEFDWVKARTECSPDIVFERLRMSAKSDAHSRTQTLLEKNANYGFVVTSHGSTFSVVLQGNGLHRAIVFTKTAEGVDVIDEQDRPLLKATLTLSNECECRLKVSDTELDLWQFRKMALEEFFFSNPWR